MGNKKELMKTISRNFEEQGDIILPCEYEGRSHTARTNRTWDGFMEWLWELPRKKPKMPLWLAICALAASIAMPIIREFLEGTI